MYQLEMVYLPGRGDTLGGLPERLANLMRPESQEGRMPVGEGPRLVKKYQRQQRLRGEGAQTSGDRFSVSAALSFH